MGQEMHGLPTPQGPESWLCCGGERQNRLSPLLCLPVLKTHSSYEVVSVHCYAG